LRALAQLGPTPRQSYFTVSATADETHIIAANDDTDVTYIITHDGSVLPQEDVSI
jgi:hypothetical protein